MRESYDYEHQWSVRLGKVEHSLESRLSFEIHVGGWLTFSNTIGRHQSFKADISWLREEWL